MKTPALNKMLLVFLLVGQAAAAAAAAAIINERKKGITCDGMIFHDVYYDREVLFQGLGKPYNLVFHKFSGTLFFSHTVEKGAYVDFKITYCHVNKRICKDIEGIPGGYAIAYDAVNDDMYFGGHEGIYRYNFLTKNADFFTEKGKSIWGLFVRKNFYYIEYPTQSLHVFQNNGFVKVAESIGIEIDNFFISKHNHIYFANKTALYKLENGSRRVIHLNDEISVRQIVEDSYGVVYFVASDGIYMEERPYTKIRKVALVDQAYGLSFDESENLIYSNDNAIYRLHPSVNNEVCYTHMTQALTEEVSTRKTVDALLFAKDLLRSGFF